MGIQIRLLACCIPQHLCLTCSEESVITTSPVSWILPFCLSYQPVQLPQLETGGGGLSHRPWLSALAPSSSPATQSSRVCELHCCQHFWSLSSITQRPNMSLPYFRQPNCICCCIWDIICRLSYLFVRLFVGQVQVFVWNKFWGFGWWCLLLTSAWRGCGLCVCRVTAWMMSVWVLIGFSCNF